jgi:penicillin-insensitive murein endopeptidase
VTWADHEPRRRPPRGWRGAAVAVALLAVAGVFAGSTGCTAALAIYDFSSVSRGSTSDGSLHRPARLPRKGVGWMVPDEWRARNRSYGTDELVGAIVKAAGRVRQIDRRATLGVGDLSAEGGGKLTQHGSHRSGRDVDLIFYSVDTRGKPLPPPKRSMVHFGEEGEPFIPKGEELADQDPTWADRRFDDKRNWLLVESLLGDPDVRVQWIFVANPLRARMLRWAERHDRPRWAIEYARLVMRQPGGRAEPHDDHFHVRVYCSREDRSRGCEDRQPIWQHEKKAWKYAGPERYEPGLWQFARVGIVFLPRG